MEAKDGVGSSGIRVPDGYEPYNVGAGLSGNSHPLSKGEPKTQEVSMWRQSEGTLESSGRASRALSH